MKYYAFITAQFTFAMWAYFKLTNNPLSYTLLVSSVLHFALFFYLLKKEKKHKSNL